MLRIIKFRKLMFSFIDRLHVSSLSQGCDPEGGKVGGGGGEGGIGKFKRIGTTFAPLLRTWEAEFSFDCVFSSTNTMRNNELKTWLTFNKITI